jgi:hypothetical protein
MLRNAFARCLGSVYAPAGTAINVSTLYGVMKGDVSVPPPVLAETCLTYMTKEAALVAQVAADAKLLAALAEMRGTDAKLLASDAKLLASKDELLAQERKSHDTLLAQERKSHDTLLAQERKSHAAAIAAKDDVFNLTELRLLSDAKNNLLLLSRAQIILQPRIMIEIALAAKYPKLRIRPAARRAREDHAGYRLHFASVRRPR